MKVLITTSSFAERDNADTAALLDAGIELIFNPWGRRLSEADALSFFSEHDPVGVVAGVEPLTANVLCAAPALKAIARCGTGLDSVDLKTSAARGVRVSNTPAAPGVAVAELTIGLMLSVLRQIAQADRIIRGGKWKALTGGLLGARTVGLIGYGRIGQRVGALASAFGAKIIAYDPFYRSLEAPFVSLETLLAQADIVSLHAAPGSLRLSEEHLSRMKRGAILINTARGDLVDEDALLSALQSGALGGAGLDVFTSEPYSGPLSAIDTVVLTAHMGSYAAESRSLQEREALANLVADLRLAGVIG
ncbi:phosphoglycerate dehydrogenase [soil metagenome]